MSLCDEAGRSADVIVDVDLVSCWPPRLCSTSAETGDAPDVNRNVTDWHAGIARGATACIADEPPLFCCFVLVG